MHELYPLLIVGGVIGLFSIVFLVFFFYVKEKSEVASARSMKDIDIVIRLLRYGKPYKGSFFVVLILMIFSISYDVLSPLFIGKIEELIKSDFELKKLYVGVCVYVLMLLVSLICSYFQSVMLQKIGQKMLSGIREDVFTRIESLSHSQLSEIPVGALVTRITNDTESISRMFTDTAVELIKNTFMIMGVLCAMLCLHYKLTLLVLCFVPFVVLFTVIFRKFSRRAFRRVKDGTTSINAFLSENLSGMKIIQIFNREDKKREEFEERNKKLGKAKRGQIFVFGIFRPMIYMLYISSILFLLYLGGRGYIKGSEFLGSPITGGIIVSFYMYISTFFTPIQNLADQFDRLQSAFASSEKIFSVLDMKPSVVDAQDAVELNDIKGEIEFRNVWFAYEGEEWILKDVSFKVEAGQTAAFVGSTGAGKTTILSLICRNYDIQKGTILLDGIDIKTIKLSSLRRHFGQMLQDVFLFSGTIRSNLVLGEDNKTDEEIIRACKYVNADSIINKLELGLDEEVRERGNNFSAGQRQLLSFTRTVLHKPKIMILDEATANIDTETELLIQDSLEKMMNIGTLLIVAHRLSTIQKADVIFVLSDGKIQEQGNHSSLLKNKGHYYDLYKLQFDKSQSAKSED